MWPRMPCRKQFYFLSFILMITFVAYSIVRNGDGQGANDSLKRTRHEDSPADGRKAARNAKVDSRTRRDRPVIRPPYDPYTMPSEVDYETLKELLPHMWKNSLDVQAPISCEFVTFDYNPNMNLGESMFIYAALYGIARRTNRVPFIGHRIGFPLTQTFRLQWMPTSGLSTDGSFVKQREQFGCCKYDDSYLNISCTRKTIIGGYRQNYLYFHTFTRELLATEFVFEDDVGKTCLKEFNELLSKNSIPKNCQLVGVHVRHPDEITSRLKERGHVGADPAYLKKALDYFIHKFSEDSCVVFIVAGNEGGANKDVMPEVEAAAADKTIKILYLEESAEAVQFCMLTLCQHTIMTTGPTGWWAAFMTQQSNNGDVLFQMNYAPPDSSLFKELDRNSYFPTSWIGK